MIARQNTLYVVGPALPKNLAFAKATAPAGEAQQKGASTARRHDLQGKPGAGRGRY